MNFPENIKYTSDHEPIELKNNLAGLELQIMLKAN